MHPLVGFAEELHRLRAMTVATANEEDDSVEYLVGTMIELPRACIRADEIAEYADFFSFGTNDLTQTALGLSRDDAEGKFLSRYLEDGVLERNPFETLDQRGVGDLMRIAVERGRGAKPDLKLGICGEHGGEPESVAFCHAPRPRLRQLLALPRASRAPRGGPGGPEGRGRRGRCRGRVERSILAPLGAPTGGDMRLLAWCALICVGALALAACGGEKKENESELSEKSAAACTGSALTEAPKLPAGFPQVENVTYTQQSTQGPTNVVEGYFEGSLDDAHDEFKKELQNCRLRRALRRARGSRLGGLVERRRPKRPGCPARGVRERREDLRPHNEPPRVTTDRSAKLGA